MAEREEGVQTYLTRHKITSLLEDLLSKVIKELPADPIDFLIRKLQVLQRQRKKDSPHVSSISPPKASRGRIQVTGTSIASKTPSKSPVSDRLSKSTSGLRPVTVKPKSTLASSSASSLSKTTPTRPPTTSRPVSGGGTKKTSSKIPTASVIKPRAATSKPVSRITKQTSSRPSTAPVSGGKPAGTPSASRIPSSSIPRAGKCSSKSGGEKISSTSAGRASAVKTATAEPSSSPRSKLPLSPSVEVAPKDVVAGVALGQAELPTGNARTHSHEAKQEAIAELFGEPKKSSKRQFFVESENEVSSDLGVESDGSGEDDVMGVEHVSHHKANNSGIDIQRIMERRHCKHAKKSRRNNLRLPESVSKSSTRLSVGYDEDDTESGDSDVAAAELLEDPDALRDEGVEVTRQNYTIKKSSELPDTGEVIVCARCAKALGKSEQFAVGGLDFESASQVGSHASYPQWGSEVLGSSVEQPCSYPVSERDQETSSEVTLESHDTWGGLAPAPPQPQLSDEESELQLPPPPPLQGNSWTPQAVPQRNVHGWGQQT